MTHAFITIVAPLALNKVADAEFAIDAMGNPARLDIKAALDVLDGDNGTHFASMHAIRSQDGVHAWLVLEFSADGGDEEALRRLLKAMSEHIRTVFTFASDWRDGGDLEAYLTKRKVVPGGGWFSDPGVVFTGTPGMTVGRIRREASLAARVASLVGELPGAMSGLDRVQAVRRAIAAESSRRRLSVAETDPPFVPGSVCGSVGWVVCEDLSLAGRIGVDRGGTAWRVLAGQRSGVVVAGRQSLRLRRRRGARL